MRIGLEASQQRMSWAELVRRVRYAEDAGFDGWWGFDHFQPMYGEGPGECFEAYTTMAALSGLTSRIRLGVLVAGVTYRHPSMVAAQATTIDHASGGRLELTLGSAWFQPEHAALGIPFPPTGERLDMLDEALTILRGLLTTDGFTYEGAHWQVRDATIDPKPVQRPTPPLWVAATGERRALPLAARHADAWHSFGSPAELTARSATLSRLAEQAGRDPGTILRSASLDLSQPWDAVRADAEAYRTAGFGYLICGWPGEGEAHLDHFVEHVLPGIAG
ncbi:MAG: TIGR03560 family F420-dependent LLM class oxidoreductase [Acidimicrobiales bacterium]|nr:TIGR03560 family F420-dependent LLM class oxidoreductase [Acidimicrobiales bacterium]